MLFSSKIQIAITFAIKVHEIDRKQKRKGKDIPYITHPLTVGLILARAGASEDVVVGGILHDAIEDSIREKKVSREMIAGLFGENVAELVDSVTEQDKKLSWEERKKKALEHIKSMSQDSLLIKSADIISNGTETVADYAEKGEALFQNFNAPREKVLGHYIKAIQAIMARWPENPLSGDLQELEKQLAGI